MIFPHCSTGAVEILNHWQENKMFIQNLDVLRILRMCQYLGALPHILNVSYIQFSLGNLCHFLYFVWLIKIFRFLFANPLHTMQMLWRENTKCWKTSSHFSVLVPIFKLYFVKLKLLMSYPWLSFSLSCWNCSSIWRGCNGGWKWGIKTKEFREVCYPPVKYLLSKVVIVSVVVSILLIIQIRQINWQIKCC